MYLVSTAEPATWRRPCIFDNDRSYFSCSNNRCSVDPGIANATPGAAAGSNNQPVGGTWIPGNGNFAITTSSAAHNYGRTEAYLPAQGSDAGACYHTLTTCPTSVSVTHGP
jgi:hypothetical protein